MSDPNAVPQAPIDAHISERVLLIAAGLLLVYPTPTGDWIGLACMAVVAASQKLRMATSLAV